MCWNLAEIKAFIILNFLEDSAHEVASLKKINSSSVKVEWRRIIKCNHRQKKTVSYKCLLHIPSQVIVYRIYKELK
jgi:hypothetical protein